MSPKGWDVEPEPRPDLPDVHDGDGLITASWWGTAILVVGSVAGLLVGALSVAFVVVALVLFLVGTAAFVRAYLLAVERSRESEINMGGLVFLLGCAPRRVRRHLTGSFAAQVAVAFGVAWLGFGGTSGDAFNSMAFALFVPMYGLGLSALWGAHYGVFPPRPTRPSRGRGGSGGRGR